MCSIHTHARQDPTRTLTIRRRLEAQLNKRFRKLRGDIRRYLLDNPVSFLTIEQIMGFIGRRTEALLLSDQSGLSVNLDMTGRMTWFTSSISQAWNSGQSQAATQVAAVEQALEAAALGEEALRRMIEPRRQAILDRALSELKSTTEEMQTVIRRELVEGIEAGLNPRDIARAINDRIAKVSQNRARLIARTEVVRAHHKAKMATFRQAGIDGVIVKAEWVTAGDSRVCERCEALEGKIFKIDEIENMIPLHPNCRCSAAPAIDKRQLRAAA